MKRGYVELTLRLLIFLGVTGSGKSLFQRLVLGLPVPEFSPSTALAEPSVRTMSICQVGVDANAGGDDVQWDMVGPRQMMDMVAETIKEGALVFDLPKNTISQIGSLLVKELQNTPATFTSQPSLISEQKENSSQKGDSNQVDEQVDKASTETTAPSTEVNTKPEATAGDSKVPSISEAILKVKKINSELIKKMSDSSASTIKKLMDVNFIYLLDSGGQPPFREMLPHFVQQASAIILMQKLNETLDFTPTIRYRGEGGKVDKGYTSQLTNEQILYQYIQAVQSYQCKVLVVGTHRDREGECKETRHMKNKQLLETLLPVVQDQVVMYHMGSEDQLMFPVDCTSRKQSDLETAKEFRKRIMSECEGRKEKIPLSWFILEQVLQSIAQEMKVTVLSFKECFKTATRILNMSEESCQAAIKYLSKLNIMFYCPEILPDIVFVSAQVILDKITELVCCSHALRTNERATDAKVVPSCMRGISFRNLGQINAKLLGKAFPSHYRDTLFTATHFMKLLKYLLIAGKLLPNLSVGKCENENYFMPSLLPDLPVGEIAKYRVTSPEHPLPEDLASEQQPAPLVIYYHKMWLPVGVMSSLVVYLRNVSKWELVVDKCCKPACLYHNCVQFQLPKGMPGSVVLIDSTKFLEIHVHSTLGLGNHLVCIRDEIVNGLNYVHKSLHYDSAEAKIGFLCSDSHHGDRHLAKEPHLATVTASADIWKCNEDHNKGGKLSVRQKFWKLEDIAKG